MERFDLGDDKLPVTIFGQEIDLKKPGMKQVLHHENAIKDAGEDPDKIFELMKGFIVGLGMPEDIADRMQIDQYLKLIEFLRPKKS